MSRFTPLARTSDPYEEEEEEDTKESRRPRPKRRGPEPSRVPERLARVRRSIRAIGTPSGKGFILSVATYNILAQVYARADYFPYVEKKALTWQRRGNTVKEDLLHLNADVLCAQEVDHFDQYAQAMNTAGYDSLHVKRSGKKLDGCAIFYRRDILQVVAFQTLELNEAKHCDPKCQKRMLRDNVAQIAAFEIIADCGGSSSSSGGGSKNGSSDRKRSIISVANIHVFWDPDFLDVKLLQVNALLTTWNSFLASLPVPPEARILCGDFNALPTSEIYEFLATGTVSLDLETLPSVPLYRFKAPKKEKESNNNNNNNNNNETTNQDDEDCKQPTGILSLSHGHDLQSVYGNYNPCHETQEIGAGEPAFTNFKKDFTGCIDYIWYAGNAKPLTLLELPEAEALASEVALPSTLYPSDHLPLRVDLEVCAHCP